MKEKITYVVEVKALMCVLHCLNSPMTQRKSYSQSWDESYTITGVQRMKENKQIINNKQ